MVPETFETHPGRYRHWQPTYDGAICWLAMNVADESAHSGVTWIAALNGTCAGGGYELALACDEIILVEGIKGKRAADWKLVDHVVPRSRFEAFVNERAQALVVEAPAGPAVKGVSLEPLEVRLSDNTLHYTHIEVKSDRARRSAELTIHAPKEPLPQGLDAIVAAGSRWWPLRAFRELDDALLRLRFHHEEINILTLHSRGDQALVLEADRALLEHAAHPFVRETLGNVKRTLRRLDLMAKSLFAVLDEGSCFAGTLLEVALAADRRYLLCDRKHPVAVALNALNGGHLRTFNGSTRLALLAGPRRSPRASTRSTPPRPTKRGWRRWPPTRATSARSCGCRRGTREPFARRAHRPGGEPAVRGAGERGQQDLRPPHRVAELDLHATEFDRPARRADPVRQAREAAVRLAPH